MTVFRAPALDKAAPIVNPIDGRPSVAFQRFWQNLSFTAEASSSVLPDVANKVDKNTSTGWHAATGTGSLATFATYAAPTISNPPTQAEVQAIANHVQILSQHMKAVIDGLLTAEVFDT